MGNLANFVVVEESGWRLHYSHWAANQVLKWLAPGPDVAVAFIDAQLRCEPDDWLDDVWCEGGALVDLSRRQLLWYGDESVLDLAGFRAASALLGGQHHQPVLLPPPGDRVRRGVPSAAGVRDHRGAKAVAG